MDHQDLAFQLMALFERPIKEEPQTLLVDFSRGEPVLLSLLLRRGVISPGEAGRTAGVSSARIAAALRDMERKGWIDRACDPSDHRRTMIQLTEAGRAHILSLRAAVHTRLQRILEELGEEDAAEYLRISRRIRSIAEAVEKETTE